MIKRNLMTTLAVAAMTLLAAACADDYDDSALWDKVNDHEERLAALEKWQEQTNQSIAAMQELLNTTDMITGVSAVTEDGETVGYTITFLHSDPITIYNGAKGADGEDGDTWFAEAPRKEGNYYVFTLANDGGSFKVAAYQPFCILAKGETLESFDNATVPVNEATTLYLSIDEGIEYSSIVAQATPVDGDAVLTRADGWSAKVAESTDGITVTVTPGNAGYALLDVSLLLTDGGKLTASRLLTKGYSYDNNTYTVYTADGLKAWAEAAQSDFSLNCILAADITLPTVAEGESNWTPIGTHDHYYNRYTGTFDGGGHTITGLTINQSGTDHVGLFGCIGGRGTVKNLTLENVNIIGHDNVGGVMGFTNHRVTACYNASGDVMGTGDRVGGVAGYNDMGATITACYWSNYDGNGIGANYGTGTHTKVDGTTVTWQTAVDAMNAALQYSEWRYELTGALPTLKKQ